MSLRLYDTATRELRDFVPLTEGRVGLYICGLTTQGTPHIGHLRFTVAFDVLRRWLTVGHGYEVTLVRNVTDIDDKILRRSAENDVPWWAWSYRFERETSAALEVLGVLPATYEPRATGHIPEMIDLMDTLVDKGHAYPAVDGSGDVYFDVRSWPAYGELTHQSIEDMAPAEDADPRGKRDGRDFALWKGAKADEPATAGWASPYGVGRPGWHLECSAMARKYLGDEFDIHGGGIDLRFPHHENELAQSRAAGLGFARYWMHNAWLTAGGEKMSKSLGNGMAVSELVRVARPIAVRYYLTASHYRSTIEYQDSSLAEAEAAVERIQGFLLRAAPKEGWSPADAQPSPERARELLPVEFGEALDDDLAVSQALAVIHDTVRAGNVALDEADRESAAQAARAVIAMTEVLGVNPLSPHWDGEAGSDGSDLREVVDALVSAQLEARQAARAGRDFATADAIRDQLTAAGITIEDTPAGPRWARAPRGAASDPTTED